MRKTTKSFKEIMFMKAIYPSLKLKGIKTCFPYTWDGNQRWAILKHGKLFKIIKWDNKKI